VFPNVVLEYQKSKTIPLGTGVPKSLIIPNPALLSVVPLIKEPMYLPAVTVIGATLAKRPSRSAKYGSVI
jgi:hypothetical protein